MYSSSLDAAFSKCHAGNLVHGVMPATPSPAYESTLRTSVVFNFWKSPLTKAEPQPDVPCLAPRSPSDAVARQQLAVPLHPVRREVASTPCSINFSLGGLLTSAQVWLPIGQSKQEEVVPFCMT